MNQDKQIEDVKDTGAMEAVDAGEEAPAEGDAVQQQYVAPTPSAPTQQQQQQAASAPDTGSSGSSSGGFGYSGSDKLAGPDENYSACNAQGVCDWLIPSLLLLPFFLSFPSFPSRPRAHMSPGLPVSWMVWAWRCVFRVPDPKRGGVPGPGCRAVALLFHSTPRGALAGACPVRFEKEDHLWLWLSEGD